MILTEIRDYIRDNKRAALFDMANRFDIEADAIRGMLEKFIAKGKVIKLPAGTACGGGCCKCDSASIEIYEWQDC